MTTLDGYISELKIGNTDVQVLWEKHAIRPYWSKLSMYAPFDISDGNGTGFGRGGLESGLHC